MLYPDVPTSGMYAAIPYLAACAGAACGGAALLFLRSRYGAARLDKLELVARQWARGDWGQRAGMNGRDPLAKLGGTLDGLADYVQARLGDMESQAGTLAEQAALLDLAHDAIMVWDLQTGAIRFWNRGAEELYGWTRAEVGGRTPQAVLRTEFPIRFTPSMPSLPAPVDGRASSFTPGKTAHRWWSPVAGRCRTIKTGAPPRSSA